MPSGAKKRKAAKKKKENQSTNPPNTSSTSTHGDDVKLQVDKESDVEEVSSPASHDHQSTLREVENEETRMEENIVAEKDSVIQVEREFKTERELNEKDGKIEHDLSGSSSNSSGSTSSSDDESHDVKNSLDIVDIAPVVESVKAEVNVTSQGDNSVASSESTENVEEMPSSFVHKVGISGSDNEERIVIQPDKNTSAVLDPKESVVPENDDRLTLSYDAHRDTVDNVAEHEEDSGVTQPLLAGNQQPKQTTSWKSCCGLFEFVTGSDR